MNQYLKVAVLKNKGRITIASTLIISIIVLTVGFYSSITTSRAASLTYVKDTLSASSTASLASAPSTTANHTIQFVTQTAIKNGDTITIAWDTLAPADEFVFPNAALAGYASSFDLATSSAGQSGCATAVDEAIGGGFSGANRFSLAVSSSTDDMTITVTSTAGTYIATGSCVVVRFGTNAVFGASGTLQITNPGKTAAAGTADINDVKITFTGTPSADTGTALVATIEGVTVSVTVDSTLSFSMAGVAAASCSQGGPGASSTITTTTSTVPFGSSGITSNTFYKGCHLLTVSTNASSGYAITVEENTNLISAGGAVIQDTICGANFCGDTISAASTTPWSTSTDNGFGYTCDGTNCSSFFNSATEYNTFPCRGTTAQCDPGSGDESANTPISSSIPVSAVTSTIVYKLSISGTQTAGSYSNTITYIATPTF